MRLAAKCVMALVLLQLFGCAIGTSSQQVEPFVRLKIRSEPPGADVYVSGIYYATTPAVLDLGLGQYMLEVQKPGYKTYRRLIKENRTIVIPMNVRLRAEGEALESSEW